MGDSGSSASRAQGVGISTLRHGRNRSEVHGGARAGARHGSDVTQLIEYQRNAFLILCAAHVSTHVQLGPEAIRHTPGGAGERFHAIHLPLDRSRTR